MVRNIIGSILALAAAAAAVLSPFLIWFDGRRGHDYRVSDLFNGITATSSAVVVSLLLPFAFAALVTLIGLVLRSRLLVALAGLVVLGFTVLWMVRQGQVSDGLSITGGGSGLGLGVAYALGGGIVLLLAALVMSGRHARFQAPEAPYPYPEPVRQEPGPVQPEPQAEDWGPYGAHPYGTDQYGPTYGQEQEQGQRYGGQPQPYGGQYQPPVYGHPWEGPHKYGPPQPPQDGDTQSLPVDRPGDNGRDDTPPRH
ncbi:proline-rich domain-containing protein [Streptomyces sp. NPDC056909]|uniref:proline-rich domain-containing protein n=1 Tax=Streptomyces sp. NPDC056909 TaxID=3345963 RepID=UPI0036AB20F5